MKSLLSLVPLFELLAVGAVVVSCSNGEARFAKEVAGIWQGTPETVSDNSAITATIIDTYDFAPASMTANETLSGSITVTGMVNVTTQIVGDSVSVEPIGLSAAAHTTISGTWTVIDDDEIALSFDPQTLVVNVDPDAVSTSVSAFQPGEPRIDQMRQQLSQSIERGIRTALTARYASMRHMDDVKVKGALLKYEMDHLDYVLTKQMK